MACKISCWEVKSSCNQISLSAQIEIFDKQLTSTGIREAQEGIFFDGNGGVFWVEEYFISLAAGSQ